MERFFFLIFARQSCFWIYFLPERIYFIQKISFSFKPYTCEE
jgi:hypothetical protein